MKRGFGIAETLIASTIIAALILSFMGITTVMSHAAQLSYQQSVAANLAQRRIEGMRFAVERAWTNSRHTTDTVTPADWAQSVVSDVSPQVAALNGINYSTKVTVDNNFGDLPALYAARESGTYVTASTSDAVSLYRRVHVDVTWTDTGAARSYSLETVVTNWREGVL